MFSNSWFEWIQKPMDVESIKAESKRHQITYRFWFSLTLILIFVGLAVYYTYLRTDGVIAGVGLILMLVGLINSVLMKLWAHVMLSMFRLAFWSGRR